MISAITVYAILTVTSATYGDLKSDPMPSDECHEKMHIIGAEYEKIARIFERHIPADLKKSERKRRLDEIWDYKISCKPYELDT
jgi:hypothetical protein